MSDRETIGEAAEPPVSRANDAALNLVEGAIRMKEADITRTQARLVEVIEAEKAAHENVMFWSRELNSLVAARQDLERSRATLMRAPEVPLKSDGGGAGADTPGGETT